MNKTPLVSIIIPNYNGEKYLPLCLSSLLKTKYKKFEIILVDDVSSDGSIKIIKSYIKKSKNINFLRNKVNIGAAASRNRAIKKAKGEIVVFLDNDTEVRPGWLGELLKPFENTSVGATCPKMPMLQDKSRITTAGLFLIPHTGWGIALKGEKTREVVSISACMVVRKEVIEKIGGFDEKLAVHTEDLDFSWRIWIGGWKIIYVPDSVVYHKFKGYEERARLMNATKSFVYFHINKNTFRTLIKNYELKSLIKYLPIAFLIVFGRGIFVAVRDKEFSALIQFIKAVKWNIVNFRDTLKQRKFVQSLRVVSDDYIYEKVMTKESLVNIYRRYYQ